MNPAESDLEEGEILDDSPSSPCSITNSHKKPRELPKRYVVHQKSSPIHKHKRDCKYSVHYHAKRLSKLKKSPKSKDCRKKHHKSCSQEKSHRPCDRTNANVEKSFSKNNHTFSSHNTLLAEIKESMKIRHKKQLSPKYVSKSEKNVSEIEKNNTEKIKKDDSISEVIKENIDAQLENVSSESDPKQCQHPVSNTNDLSDEINNDSKVSCNGVTDSSLKDNNEDSEDEEELRRIALATFAKRKAAADSSENMTEIAESNPTPGPEPSNICNLQISHDEIYSPVSDNYEVVDMEVDEDIQASIEILDNSEKSQSSEAMENLFVIDTKPSEDFKENTMPELRDSSDDDFETDILRAELIESLYRKKCLKNEYIKEEKSKSNHQFSIHQKQIPPVPEKKHIGKFKKLNPNFYHKQSRLGKPVLRKNVVNKAQNFLCKIRNRPPDVNNKPLDINNKPLDINNKPLDINNKPLDINNKPPVPIQACKSSERLVIALNEESSSEESADSEPENPVASIEALISDCRQKSDSCEKSKEPITNVPKAVSCLSKAQQEEYTSLMKILAKKEKLQEAPGTLQTNKNGSDRSPLDDLKLLEEKLVGFKETLKKKKEFMAYLLKDINAKKLMYMKSKLTAQQQKEKYLAAEKVRKANLCNWSKSCSDFKSVKRTVSNLESKIVQLQRLCSKVGASIQGQTYNLPSGNRITPDA